FTHRLTVNSVITGMVHNESHGQAISKERFNFLTIKSYRPKSQLLAANYLIEFALNCRNR
ncbi:hypothetical protein, partial [Candidatus Erwinia dacicola]|uniref:hypothetical protein n=1 Tax=Candidatus Erwinia dacicola TaxID=252393 RepID=UPI001C9954AD